MKVSCAFPPVPETADHIVLAEELGYETAFVYDTPALQLDCWMTLALAGVRTDRIRLGTGVLIPSLRHPLVTASAIATLVGIVGQQRVVIGAGTGFTGRRAMGQLPLSWNDFPAMVEQVRDLLRGEDVEVDGRMTRMLHRPGQAPQRPIEVPWLIGVGGPRGLAAARHAGCGVIAPSANADLDFDGFDDVLMLAFGTVMDDGETLDSPRVVETAGPGAAVVYHALLEGAPDVLAAVPDGDRFRELAEAVPESTRHLELHTGHLTELNTVDRQVVGPEALGMTLTCHSSELPARLDAFAAQGFTEVAFQPMGDVARELRAFAQAARRAS